MRDLNIASRLFNRPLMIHEGKLNIIEHLFSRHAGISLYGLPEGIALQMMESVPAERPAGAESAQPGLGLIGIYGPLLHRRLASEFPSGGPTTYAEIRQAFDQALADAEVTGIVMEFDTPGGEVSGAFDLADHIYRSRGIKPITAVVNESAFSAGYLLASSCGRIVIPRTGQAGSIGVIVSHADFSRAEDSAGITVTHLYAGARKADFSPHQPLSKEARAACQAMIDSTYDLFVETVARNRDLATQAVRDTEAGIFEGQAAVEAGLVDEVRDAVTAVADAPRRETVSMTAQAGAGAQPKELREMELNEPKKEASAVAPQNAAGEEVVEVIAVSEADKNTAMAVSTERTRILELAQTVLGADMGGRFAAVVNTNLTAKQAGELGLSLQGTVQSTQQKMLEAITSAAPQGVGPARLKTSGDDETQAAADRMARFGSVGA
jgi:signal peptide peptidase SppA